MRGSVVLLPTYNEAGNLKKVLSRLRSFTDSDILVIDDSSPDGTGKLAEKLRSCYSRLSVLHRKKKDGLGPAYISGFREALRRGYPYIVTMDADLSHDPKDVPSLLKALRYSHVALGSRHCPGGGERVAPMEEGYILGRRYLRTSTS